MLMMFMRAARLRAVPAAALFLLSTTGRDRAYAQTTPMPSMAGMPGMSTTNDPLGVPMDRSGSGTTWVPDAARLPSRHFMLGDWSLMAHGFALDRKSVV